MLGVCRCPNIDICVISFARLYRCRALLYNAEEALARVHVRSEVAEPTRNASPPQPFQQNFVSSAALSPAKYKNGKCRNSRPGITQALACPTQRIIKQSSICRLQSNSTELHGNPNLSPTAHGCVGDYLNCHGDCLAPPSLHSGCRRFCISSL